MMADATSVSLPASTSSAEDGTSTSLVLACTIPDKAEPGQVFHIRSPDGRYFEVTVPDGSSPGETLNIVVPAAPALSSSSSSVPTPIANPIDVAGGGGGGNSSSNNTVALSDASAPDTSAPSVLSSLGKLGFSLGAKIDELDSRFKISETAKAHAAAVDDKFKIKDTVNTLGAKAVDHAKVCLYPLFPSYTQMKQTLTQTNTHT